ncbi:MAG: hypothetical protein ACI4XP_03260 [Acutalibacteraceae bacterium]
MFDFSGLIDKYSTDFTVVVEGKGYYDDSGEYVKDEKSELQMNGAIMAYSEDKIYRSEGTLTKQDRVLLMQKPIDRALKGATITYKGKQYSIEDNLENAEFTGVWQYALKYISAFDKGGESVD